MNFLARNKVELEQHANAAIRRCMIRTVVPKHGRIRYRWSDYARGWEVAGPIRIDLERYIYDEPPSIVETAAKMRDVLTRPLRAAKAAGVP